MSDEPESGDENGETINRTHDDQFARIAKNGKPDQTTRMTSKT